MTHILWYIHCQKKWAAPPTFTTKWHKSSIMAKNIEKLVNITKIQGNLDFFQEVIQIWDKYEKCSYWSYLSPGVRILPLASLKEPTTCNEPKKIFIKKTKSRFYVFIFKRPAAKNWPAGLKPLTFRSKCGHFDIMVHGDLTKSLRNIARVKKIGPL